MVIVTRQDRSRPGTSFVVIASDPSLRQRHYELNCLWGEPANDNHHGVSEWLPERHPRKFGLASFVLATLIGAVLALII